MKKFLICLNCALILTYFSTGLAYANKLEKILRDHTFIFINPETGIEHTIYVGRFGNHYDEYFPCKFVDGTWRITKQGYLCLEDRVNKERRNRRKCLKPIVGRENITFFDKAGNIAFQSKLIRGNSMPLG